MMKRQSAAFLLTILVLCASALHGQTAQATSPPYFHVTLVGTGVPTLNVANYVNSGQVNASTLVETGPGGSERFLFDCGQATVTRLLQSGGEDPLKNPNIAVDKVFLTHLHSDHYADLASLYSYGWLFRYDLPLHIYGPGAGPNGPFGTGSIAYLLRFVYDADINIRAYGFKVFTFPVSGVAPVATEIGEGQVYSNNGVVVTAFLVDHHPVVPAYGFRIDYAGHSVVISGDTTYSPNLIKYSQGADVLIHEIYAWPATASQEVYDYHTSTGDWARVMVATAPKLAVMTHIAVPPGVTGQDLVNQVKNGGYSGAVQVGSDLMTIDVTDTKVVVTPWRQLPAVAHMDENRSDIGPELMRRLTPELQRRLPELLRGRAPYPWD